MGTPPVCVCVCVCLCVFVFEYVCVLCAYGEYVFVSEFTDTVW